MAGALILLLSIYFYYSRNRYISIFLLFVLVTAGFQMIPVNLMVMSGGGITKTYDWAFIFTACILLFTPQLILKIAIWKNFKEVALFSALLIISLYYSIFVQEIETSVSIRVFRGFAFFVTLFLFIPLSFEDQRKIFRLIIYTTTLASLIYCLQVVVHQSVLNMVISNTDVFNDYGFGIRYYNVPVFVYPVIFFLFFPGEVFSIRFKNPLLLINGAAILLTQHRNLIIAVFFCFSIYLLINKKIKISNFIIYLALIIGILLVADKMFGNRFTKGMDDISKSSLSYNGRATRFNEVVLSDLSTTQFRQLMFNERLDYVLKNDAKTLLGIGLMTDDSRKAKNLNFNIGIPDEDGNISQIANIDIAWASLILQLGIAGTLAFIFYYLSLLRKFFSFRSDPYIQVGILYIICLLFTSFYGSMIEMPYVTCLLMLFAAYYYNLYKTPKNNWFPYGGHKHIGNHLIIQV